jgi:hypothetical protein
MTAQIADLIGMEMNARGVSIYGLAQQSGIPRSTLQRRLARPDGFTIGELDAIAPVLGWGSALDLLSGMTEAASHASGDAA